MFRPLPILLSAALSVAPLTHALPAGIQLQDNTVADIVERVGASVVNIVSRRQVQMPGMRRFHGGGLFEYFFSIPNNVMPQQGEGSGFIFDAQGLVLTNYHVVDGATEIEISMHDGKKFKAELHGSDPRRDIAILKISDPAFKAPFPKENVATLGDSTTLRVGEFVVAIGSPFSLDRTVTMGIVSAKGRSLNAGPENDYNNLIQTDASINPGNSGGPLLNIHGEVIGINTAISRAGQGIGFAIPINLAKRIAGDVSAFGRVRRSWLGVEMSNVDQESYHYLGLDSPRGVVLRKVLADTPAQKAGLKVGDVIVKVNGTLIENGSILVEKIQEVPVGEEAVIEIVRKGKPMTIQVKLDEFDAKGAAKATKNSLDGLDLRSLTDSDRKLLGLRSNTAGVLVEAVKRGSAAFKMGLRPNDVVIQVNRMAVTSPEVLTEALKAASSGDGTLLVLIREGYLHYLEI